ncbi:MAG: dihydroneopterin aldolase [Candidatus Eiseniibacteriota bacterium]
MALIRLEGLSLFGHHGASASERRAGTRLDVDVLLEVDSTRAERTDRLSDTVSYDDIEAAVRTVVEQDSFRLLEALAAHLAATCVERFGANSVRVRLTKQNLAWPTGGRVSVEVARTAPAPGRGRRPRNKAHKKAKKSAR